MRPSLKRYGMLSGVSFDSIASCDNSKARFREAALLDSPQAFRARRAADIELLDTGCDGAL